MNIHEGKSKSSFWIFMFYTHPRFNTNGLHDSNHYSIHIYKHSGNRKQFCSVIVNSLFLSPSVYGFLCWIIVL